jgi:hypothetical protein
MSGKPYMSIALCRPNQQNPRLPPVPIHITGRYLLMESERSGVALTWEEFKERHRAKT